MLNLLKRIVSVEKKPRAMVVSAEDLRINFSRPIRFPELDRMLSGMRRSLDSDIHLTSTQEIAYSDFSTVPAKEGQQSDVKKRTTNIIVTIPNYDLIFNVRQHEGDQSVDYLGFDFRIVPSLPFTPRHLEIIENCRAYTRYYFSKYCC